MDKLSLYDKILFPVVTENSTNLSEKNKIFYALSGIKSVGKEAISNLINERKKNGPFNYGAHVIF